VSVDEGTVEMAELGKPSLQVKLSPNLTSAIRHNGNHMLLHIPAIRGCDTGICRKTKFQAAE